MKKNILSLLICFCICVSLQAQNKKMEDKNTTQQTVTFRDGKTKALNGVLVAELVEKSSISGNEKKYKYISERKDSTYTFYIHQEWVKPASGFDEFKEYIFTTNMLRDDFEIQENEPDDVPTKYYTLSLNTIDEKNFKINTYNKYQSTPDRTSTFSTFTIKSLSKASLENFLTDLKSVMPKKKTDDE